jgi:hypothetical protein
VGAADRARAWLPVAAAAAGLLAIAAVAGPSRGPGGPPLDPRATGPLGTKGLVETLRALGAVVRVGAGPQAGPGTALVLADGMDAAARDRLLAWVRAGGRLVVADPLSPLNPFPLRSAAPGPTRTLERRCGLPALRGVARVRAGSPVALAVPPEGVGCFPVGGGHWLVARAEGAGALVVVGGPGAFVNRMLARDDNAVLAAALLAPRPGTQVTVVVPPPGGTGRRGLWELLAPGAKGALAQLGLALVVAALWRGRRLGRPVPEEPAVAIEAGESVAATGRLLHRARALERAAALLREELRREVGDDPARLGVPDGPPPADEAELVALAREVEQVRAAVVSRRGGAG